jgi:hypothetical protein
MKRFGILFINFTDKKTIDSNSSTTKHPSVQIQPCTECSNTANASQYGMISLEVAHSSCSLYFFHHQFFDLLLLFFIYFTRSLNQDCIVLLPVDAWTWTPLKDEVIVGCLPDRINDTSAQAIFIRVVTYLGDDIVYVGSSSWRRWWSKSSSSITTSRTCHSADVADGQK